MIELTTGVAFLMSSLYGHGQVNANLASASDALDTVPQIQMEAKADQEGTTSVEAYVRKAYSDTPILIEVARCESQFHQYTPIGTVVRGIVNNKDVGVMQINEYYHSDDALKKGIDIYTTEGNVAFGKYLYEKYGTSPWKSSSKCWQPELAKK